MKTQPRQHISNKYNICTVVTSPVYIGSKLRTCELSLKKGYDFIADILTKVFSEIFIEWSSTKNIILVLTSQFDWLS